MSTKMMMMYGLSIRRCRFVVLPRRFTLRNASSSSSTRTTTCSEETPKKTRTTVAFIGLGNMGKPMLQNLLQGDGEQSKTTCWVYDTNRKACDQVAASNSSVVVAPSLQSIAHAMHQKQIDVVLTMLPGCNALNSVMTTLLQETKSMMNNNNNNNKHHKICFIECSTVSPTTSRQWHERWKATSNTNTSSYSWWDAPVSGGTAGATAGTLTFMLGGTAEDPWTNSTVRPLLQRMGSTILDCGASVGAGATAKLCNNLALATQMSGICEAFTLGETLGVDPNVLAQVLNASTAACWSTRVNPPHSAVAKALEVASAYERSIPAAHDYQGGFATRLMLKDLELAVATAQEYGAAVPLGTKARDLYSKVAATEGMAEKDFSVMIKYLKERGIR